MRRPLKITLEQLRALFACLSDKQLQGSFRYIIYDVMGFKQKDYCDLYHTGLATFKDELYELRDENARLKREIKELKKLRR
jgi:hypothetical protein